MEGNLIADQGFACGKRARKEGGPDAGCTCWMGSQVRGLGSSEVAERSSTTRGGEKVWRVFKEEWKASGRVARETYKVQLKSVHFRDFFSIWCW